MSQLTSVESVQKALFVAVTGIAISTSLIAQLSECERFVFAEVARLLAATSRPRFTEARSLYESALRFEAVLISASRFAPSRSVAFPRVQEETLHIHPHGFSALSPLRESR